MGGSASPGGKSGPIRVLIADKTSIGSQLLAEALQRSHRFASVVASIRADEVLAIVSNQGSDGAIISTELEGDPLRGFKLTDEINTVQPRARVVMLLDMSECEAVVQAFRAGSKGVFCRERPARELLKCITCVHEGQIWADATELGYVLEALREPPPLRLVNPSGIPLLSEREMAVVRCVAQGLTNREAAAQLNLSAHTVKNYMFRIFDKLGVSSRVELVLYVAGQMTSPATNIETRSESLPNARAVAAH